MIARQIGAVAALLLAVPASAAAVQDAVTRNLVLSSVVVRQAYEQRAAADQFAAFQKLAETESRLRAALGDARTSKAQAKELRGQLSAVQAQLEQAFSDLAAKDRDFAIRYGALESEMRGVVGAASPAKLALLERFANGDRKGAYAAIEELTYAENHAREVATAKAGAENLKRLLALKGDMAGRGEAGMADIVKIQQDIVRLDPADLKSATSLIGMLTTMRRFEEAADLVDTVESQITDPWERLDFEGNAVQARVQVRGLVPAFSPLIAASSAVLKERPLAEQDLPHQTRYCRALLGLVQAAPVALDALGGDFGQLMACLGLLAKTNSDVFTVVNSSILLHRYFAVSRKEREFAITQPIVEQMRRASGGIGDFKAVRVAIQFDLDEAIVGGMIAQGEPVPAEFVPTAERVRDTVKTAEGLYGTGGPVSFTGQIISNYAMIQHYLGKPLLAREALQLLVNAPAPPDPESSRGDIAGYLGKVQWASRLAEVCLDLIDLRCAADALDRARPLLARLQVLRPLDDGEMFMANTRDVYMALMEASLAAARLRLERDELAEADGRLLGVVDRLAPFMVAEWWNVPWPAFRAQALLLSGEIRGQQGLAEPARVQLQAALKLAQDHAAKEPRTFLWTTVALQARLRLAQLDGNAAEFAAVRAQQIALAKAGKQFERAAWLLDLASWKPGRPPRWRNASVM